MVYSYMVALRKRAPSGELPPRFLCQIGTSGALTSVSVRSQTLYSALGNFTKVHKVEYERKVRSCAADGASARMPARD